MCYKVLLILVCLNMVALCSTYRLLGVFPFPSHSHHHLGVSLMKGLAEAGHDVTFISPFSTDVPPKNGIWEEIVLDGQMELLQQIAEANRYSSTVHSWSPWKMLFAFNNLTLSLSENTLAHPKVQVLLNSEVQFDTVIATEFIMDSIKGLADHFDAHLILFANHRGLSWFNKYVGNPLPPSFIPDMMTDFPPRMTFSQRLVNFAFKMLVTANEYFIVYPFQAELAKKYIPNLRSELIDVLYNTSLVLTYAHGSIGVAQPSVPVMVDVGGFHINPPKKLPDKLQQILDEGKNGVIYFSLGSHLKSEALPPAVIQAILVGFSKRKETVLWKWGYDSLPGKPDNVHIGKWFPQQEILAHPNVKLFISHGGMLSTMETVYHGVPVVLIPMMVDQKLNAITAVNDGYGISLKVEEIDEEIFERAVEEVLSNPQYKQSANQRSIIMKDNRHTPIEDAVYWVEYIIRHQGARHLRVVYADMPWYQFYLLDVIGLIFAVLFVVIWLFKKFGAYSFRILAGTKTAKLKVS